MTPSCSQSRPMASQLSENPPVQDLASCPVSRHTQGNGLDPSSSSSSAHPYACDKEASIREGGTAAEGLPAQEETLFSESKAKELLRLYREVLSDDNIIHLYRLLLEEAIEHTLLHQTGTSYHEVNLFAAPSPTRDTDTAFESAFHEFWTAIKSFERIPCSGRPLERLKPPLLPPEIPKVKAIADTFDCSIMKALIVLPQWEELKPPYSHFFDFCRERLLHIAHEYSRIDGCLQDRQSCSSGSRSTSCPPLPDDKVHVYEYGQDGKLETKGFLCECIQVMRGKLNDLIRSSPQTHGSEPEETVGSTTMLDPVRRTKSAEQTERTARLRSGHLESEPSRSPTRGLAML